MSRVSTLITTAVLRPMAVEFARQIGAVVREHLRARAAQPRPAPRPRTVRATVTTTPAATPDPALAATLAKLGFTAAQVTRATRDPAVKAVSPDGLEAQIRVALRVLSTAEVA